MPIPRRAALLLALPLALAGCESGTDADDELSSAEAEALASVILDLTLDAAFVVGAQSAQARVAGPAAAPVTFDNEIAFAAPCPLGGEVAVALDVAGTTDDETGEVDLRMTIDQEHRGCRVEAESGQRFTLDGDPAVTVVMDMLVDADFDVSITGEFGGAVDWETDGREGSCGISLDFSATGNELEETGTFSMVGSVCGIDVSQTVSG